MKEMLRRGVFTEPWLTAAGGQCLVAVTSEGCKLAEVQLAPGAVSQPVTDALWRLLDAVDPVAQPSLTVVR